MSAARTETKRRGAGDLLALGFGTSVVMWLAGYVARLVPGAVPSWLLAVVLLACVLGGGFAAGRLAGRGARFGALVGLVASLINLMVLGSLLGGQRPNELLPSAPWWVLGSLAVGAALGLAGAAAGAARRAPASVPDWTAAFATVAAGATFLLLIAGGLVTSHDAGLAVVDWPNSYGYNIFLYPLARMTGGIYYEHAHRLMGSLVGLTTLVLAVHLQIVERRRWLKRLGWLALAAVIVQGLLGGLRVTGRLTLSTSPADVAPSVALAVVHGVLAQVFFATVVAIAAFTSAAWRRLPPARVGMRAGLDHALSALLLPVLVTQLVLGAVLRHLAQALIVHIAFALVVVVLALAVAVRATTAYRGEPVLPRLGRAMIWLVSVQVTLGVLAYAAVTTRTAGAPAPPYEVAVATAHQATGALLLSGAVLLAVWLRRLRSAEA